MSRLDELVSDYGVKDAELKGLKKVCDEEKEEIKDLLTEQGESDWTAGGYTVKKSVSERVSLNEEKMLEVLTADWEARYGNIPCPYIKTRQYVDMDELESVLYAEELPKEVLTALNECKTVQTVVTLKCTKAKEKKKDE